MPQIDESKVKPEWEDYLKFPSAGWINFWSSFTNTSLEDFILNIYDKIEVQTNPLHEDNIVAFNAAVTNLKTNTFIGSIDSVANNTIPDLLQHLNGSSSVFVFNTAGVTTDLFTIPSGTIVLDMSWYAPFKRYGDMVISGFMWIFYLIMLFRHLPDLLSGSGLHFENPSNVDEPNVRENFVIDDNGVVLKHSTTSRYSGHTVTQNHDV